jgi:hypothetical protein
MSNNCMCLFVNPVKLLPTVRNEEKLYQRLASEHAASSSISISSSIAHETAKKSHQSLSWTIQSDAAA